MDDDDPFTAPPKRTVGCRDLFAVPTELKDSVEKVFHTSVQMPVPTLDKIYEEPWQTVAPSGRPNPYAEIQARNKEQETLKKELATTVHDPRQVLVSTQPEVLDESSPLPAHKSQVKRSMVTRI